MASLPEKRYFRFGLRTMLVVVAVVALLAWKVQQAERQKEVVRWVRKWNGEVHYDFEFDNTGKWKSGVETASPEWLCNLIGVDYLATVVGLQLGDVNKYVGMKPSCIKVTDLSPLAKLTDLKILYLFNTYVSDVSPLEHLTNLKKLILADTEVHDISFLASLTELRSLNLKCPQVDDLSPLLSMEQLQTLCLDATQATDFSPLAHLTELSTLSLSDTRFSDASVLSNMTKLTRSVNDLSKTTVFETAGGRVRTKCRLHSVGVTKGSSLR
jgi:hypothetical protein